MTGVRIIRPVSQSAADSTSARRSVGAGAGVSTQPPAGARGAGWPLQCRVIRCVPGIWNDSPHWPCTLRCRRESWHSCGTGRDSHTSGSSLKPSSRPRPAPLSTWPPSPLLRTPGRAVAPMSWKHPVQSCMGIVRGGNRRLSVDRTCRSRGCGTGRRLPAGAHPVHPGGDQQRWRSRRRSLLRLAGRDQGRP